MKLAADANVLLSALIGGRAKLALNHPRIGEIFATEHTFAEVDEYALVLAKKKTPAFGHPASGSCRNAGNDRRTQPICKKHDRSLAQNRAARSR